MHDTFRPPFRSGTCRRFVALICSAGLAAQISSPILAAQNGGTTLYVSPSGDDAQDGTKEHPIRTLQHARDLVRGFNQNMSADITVYLADGTYRLSAPLLLDSKDSGNG